jgi:chromosome partitioning protein
MRNTITVMNAKGGVGKSTLVLALAETLSTFHGKKVLVIDSDAQASVSHMLLPARNLEALQDEGQTIVDYLVAAVLKDSEEDWRRYVIGNVSDVDDARSIDVLPSDTNLTLLEREISREQRESNLRKTIGELLRDARTAYDLVLVDSAPGLSVLTECRKRNPEMGFAELLGVIINMKDSQSADDNQYEQWLRQQPENRCFSRAILRVTPLQSAAYFSPRDRSYWAKYPGQTGEQLRALADELLHRVNQAQG